MPDDIKWAKNMEYTMNINNSSVQINGLALNAPGIIYATIYTSNRIYFWSTSTAPKSVIRYLDDESDRKRILQNYLISQSSNCSVSQMNTLTIYCNGINNKAPDYQRQDIAQLIEINQTASSYQVVSGSDSTYFKADQFLSLNVTVSLIKLFDLLMKLYC